MLLIEAAQLKNDLESGKDFYYLIVALI
jgi:hypothetical protein